MRYTAGDFSYRQTEKTTRRRLVVASIVVVLLFLLDLGTSGALRALVRTGSGALWQTGAYVEQAVVSSGFFATHASLAAENAQLRTQLEHSMEKSIAAGAVLAENAQLRELTRLADAEPGITAPIISSFRTSPYGTFFIGAGTADGVLPGDMVATPDGFIVGRVTDVSTHTALINHLFAPRAAVDALAGAVPLSLSGDGGGNAHGSVPRESAITAGDIVTAPSLGGRPVAVVGSIASDPSDAQAVVLVRSPSNLSTLQFVYVLRAQ